MDGRGLPFNTQVKWLKIPPSIGTVFLSLFSGSSSSGT